MRYGATHRGFESHSLRHSRFPMCGILFARQLFITRDLTTLLGLPVLCGHNAAVKFVMAQAGLHADRFRKGGEPGGMRPRSGPNATDAGTGCGPASMGTNRPAALQRLGGPSYHWLDFSACAWSGSRYVNPASEYADAMSSVEKFWAAFLLNRALID